MFSTWPGPPHTGRNFISSWWLPVGPIAASESNQASRTQTPDISGLWDHRSPLPMERPEKFKDRATLHMDEILAWRQEAFAHDINEGRQEDPIADLNQGHNAFWFEPRHNLTDDPTHGAPDGAPKRQAARPHRSRPPPSGKRQSEPTLSLPRHQLPVQRPTRVPARRSRRNRPYRTLHPRLRWTAGCHRSREPAAAHRANRRRHSALSRRNARRPRRAHRPTAASARNPPNAHRLLHRFLGRRHTGCHHNPLQ